MKLRKASKFLKSMLGTKEEFEYHQRLREFKQMQDKKEFEDLRNEDINNDNLDLD